MTDSTSGAPKRAHTPLSQASGKKKLLVSVPVALIAGWMWSANLPFGMALCVCFGAYAIVGLIEVIAGDSLKRPAERWDALAGWKKFLIATAVICGCFLALGLLLPLIAQ